MWPAARVLAEVVQSKTGEGRTLLELGCGVGLVAVAAAAAGFRVTVTDYYEAALECTADNVRNNTGRNPRTILLDWRTPSNLGERFDLVVASDVLYEMDYADRIPSLLAALVADRGTAIVADPGRRAAPHFLERCRTVGLAVSRHSKVPITDAERNQVIDVYELQRKLAEAGS